MIPFRSPNEGGKYWLYELGLRKEIRADEINLEIISIFMTF